MKYWMNWKRNRADPTVQFKFSEKEIQGMLSFRRGEGWHASLAGTGTVGGLDRCSRVVM